MTRATQKEQATMSFKTNSMSVIILNMNKVSRTICNGICDKSQQLQFIEIRKMISVDPAWNIFNLRIAKHEVSPPRLSR